LGKNFEETGKLRSPVKIPEADVNNSVLLQNLNRKTLKENYLIHARVKFSLTPC